MIDIAVRPKDSSICTTSDQKSGGKLFVSAVLTGLMPEGLRPWCISSPVLCPLIMFLIRRENQTKSRILVLANVMTKRFQN